MIRGLFSTDEGGAVHLPFIPFRLEFPNQPNVIGNIYFLIDTGADTTILSLLEARSIGLEVANLDRGEIGGVGGSVETRILEATLHAQNYTKTLTIHIPEDNEEIPSLLGRDFISAFTLIIRERHGAALLLDDDEADALNLPQ